jgi:hypothetical protein
MLHIAYRYDRLGNSKELPTGFRTLWRSGDPAAPPPAPGAAPETAGGARRGAARLGAKSSYEVLTFEILSEKQGSIYVIRCLTMPKLICFIKLDVVFDIFYII